MPEVGADPLRRLHEERLDDASAATTAPERSRTGAAADSRPSSSSSATIAQPCSRTARSAARNRSGSVIVCGVSARRPDSATTRSTTACGAQASNARPIDVACAGTRVPIDTLMLMIRRTGTRAT